MVTMSHKKITKYLLLLYNAPCTIEWSKERVRSTGHNPTFSSCVDGSGTVELLNTFLLFPPPSISSVTRGLAVGAV